MQKHILLIVMILAFHIAKSQNYVDLFKADYAISPQNKFDSSATTTRLQEVNGDLTIPLVINKKLAILTGLTYELTNTAFDINQEKKSLSGITLKVGANLTHSKKWSGTYLLLPKISSDLIKIDRKDFQFGGAVLMKYKKSENFNYKFGVYTNSELFSAFIVPIFGFYYLSPSKKTELKILLPLAVDLNYALTNKIRFGLNFKGQIRSYNLNTTQQEYLTRSTNDVYGYCQYSLKNGVNFQLGIGRSVGRSYRIFDETVSFALPLFYFNDKRTQINTDFADSWLLKFGAFYRLRIDKSK